MALKCVDCSDNLVSPLTEKCLPPSATGPGTEGQPGPPWITITRQKLRGALEQPPDGEDKPRAQTLKSETRKQARALESTQVLMANIPCLCRYMRTVSGAED